MQILLEAWREACRHIEIGEFVSRITPLLARELPFGTLVLRRLDLERMRIETVAASVAGEGKLPSRTRTQCSAHEMDEVLRWARGTEVLTSGDNDHDRLRKRLAPPDGQATLFAGPLAGQEEFGVLWIGSPLARVLTAKEEALLRMLLEPFSAALANDHRFHELARLREAVEADNRALLSRLQRHDISESIVGAQSGLSDVMARLSKVAPTDAPVLILGETGSGKEVIARAIHTRSPRAAGPIVRVNCGAIPGELVDSELFGHEKGSFTGAINTHTGWFERADGGTLFLDEIGELPAAAQVRLLRILQDGSFERVGGSQSLSVDVRLVAATHRNLEDMVKSGGFRQDLWYRISVFPIRLPPLRERRNDIADLAAHFARSAGKRLGGVPLAPSGEDLELLLAYDWPGNVRELAAVIERAAILGDGKRLELAAALGVSAPAESKRTIDGVQRNARDVVDESPRTLDHAMRLHIEEALVATRGKIEGTRGAAAMLHINPHTLRSRMRKLGIDWQRFRSSAG